MIFFISGVLQLKELNWGPENLPGLHISKGDLISVYRYLKEGVKKREPGPSRWCPVTGQEAVTETQETPAEYKEPFLWRWLSTGTMACPESLWSLHPWRYSRTVWRWSWATSYRWPCLSWWAWSRRPPEVPSNFSPAVMRYWKYWTGRVWVGREELEAGEHRLHILKHSRNVQWDVNVILFIQLVTVSFGMGTKPVVCCSLTQL